MQLQGGTGAFATRNHCAFRTGIPWGFGGTYFWVPHWNWKGWLQIRHCQWPEPQEMWHSEGWSGLWWVGSPCPLRSPVHLPHHQSSLSLMDRKLEGNCGLQSTWRAQQLSYHMTTGDSESELRFTSTLHLICIGRQPAKPTPLHHPLTGVGEVEGATSRSSKGEERRRASQRRTGPLPLAAVGRIGSPEVSCSLENLPMGRGGLPFVGSHFLS